MATTIRTKVLGFSLAALAASPAAQAQFIMPFGHNTTVYAPRVEESITYSTTNIFIDTAAIQRGLEDVAGAIRETGVTPEYIQSLYRRYPSFRANAQAIGLDPSRAVATDFITRYGRAAYEREIEARLTELQENMVFAADIARAFRRPPATRQLLTAADLRRRQESVFPFRLAGLLQLINNVRHRARATRHNYYGCGFILHDTQPLASPVVADQLTPENFEANDLFDPAASDHLTDDQKRDLMLGLAAALELNLSSDSHQLPRITYDTLSSRIGEVVQAGQRWVGALNMSPASDANICSSVAPLDTTRYAPYEREHNCSGRDDPENRFVPSVPRAECVQHEQNIVSGLAQIRSMVTAAESHGHSGGSRRHAPHDDSSDHHDDSSAPAASSAEGE